MVNSLTEALLFATPALVSLAVTSATWWTAPDRAAPRAGGTVATRSVRVGPKQLIPIWLVGLISATLGVLAYLGHAPEVGSGQAVHGGAIAFLATAFPLGMYWVLARLARRMPSVVVGWVASLVPLYFYAFFAWIWVAGYTQCGPQAYECPL